MKFSVKVIIFVVLFCASCAQAKPRKNDEKGIIGSLTDTLGKALTNTVKQCGVQYTSDRIVGGEDAGIDEYPWLALLFYKTNKGLRYKCGGTLVNTKTIVTAAHCFEGALKDTFEFVRLGEWNTAEEEDCFDEDDCADPPIDFKAQGVYNSFLFLVNAARGFFAFYLYVV